MVRKTQNKRNNNKKKKHAQKEAASAVASVVATAAQQVHNGVTWAGNKYFLTLNHFFQAGSYPQLQWHGYFQVSHRR